MLSLLHDFCFSDWQDEVFPHDFIADFERLAVEILTFQKHDGVSGSDGGFEQSFAVFRVVGGDGDQPWDVTVPSCETLGMLGCHGCCGSVEASEDNRAADEATAHVVQLGGAVDDLVEGLHGKVNGHELDDRLQA